MKTLKSKEYCQRGGNPGGRQERITGSWGMKNHEERTTFAAMKKSELPSQQTKREG